MKVLHDQHEINAFIIIVPKWKWITKHDIGMSCVDIGISPKFIYLL